MRKIAIIGNGETKELAPFDDMSWDIWALAWMVRDLPRCDLAFEMHQANHLDSYAGDDVHYPEGRWRDILREVQCPIVMLQRHDDIPNSAAFPRGEALLNLGWDKEHMASTVSWMASLAALETVKPYFALERVREVGLFGVELCATTEWAYQRPNAARLIGFLEGRGIRVTLPPTCKLLGIPFVYGQDSLQTSEAMTHALLFETFAQLAEQTEKMFEAAYAVREQQDRQLAEARANGGGK